MWVTHLLLPSWSVCVAPAVVTSKPTAVTRTEAGPTTHGVTTNTLFYFCPWGGVFIPTFSLPYSTLTTQLPKWHFFSQNICIYLSFNWSIVDSQCCVSFWCIIQQSDSVMCIYSSHIYIFLFIFFSVMFYYRILNIVPSATNTLISWTTEDAWWKPSNGPVVENSTQYWWPWVDIYIHSNVYLFNFKAI